MMTATWLADWGPILLLVGAWLLFMWKFTGKNSPAIQSIAELKRQNDALEKLLASHEERLRLLEEGRKRS
jgi:hypothetical protein